MLARWTDARWFHAHETARMDSLNGLPLASFKRRAWAYAADLLLAGILVWGLREMVAFAVSGVAALLGFGWHTPHTGHVPEGWHHTLRELFEDVQKLAESVLYFAVALKLGRGQTPGKLWMKIRVVSLSHDGITWWTAVERALGYGASLLEGGFGFFQYFIHRNRMCVHDRIAETIVVDTRLERQAAALPHEAE